MVAIVFPRTTSPGPLSVASGRLINVYPHKLEDDRLAWSRAPGLRRVALEAGYTHCRGLIEVGETLLAAMDTRLLSLTGSAPYTVTDLGALAGTGPVIFARNNASTPNIVAVADGAAFECTTGGAPVSYVDADVGSPVCVVYIGGYFVFGYGDGRMRTTALNAVTINTLDTAVAEQVPDGIQRLVARGSDLLAFGKSSCEIWRTDKAPAATGFPFLYGDTVQRGLICSTAVAGTELGWSNTVIFVADDGVVYALNGYQPTRISTPAIERLIEQLSDKTELIACVYSARGHSVWVLSCDDWTLCYDLQAGAWHERRSFGLDRWRVTTTAKFGDKWIAGDLSSGDLFHIDPSYNREGDNEISSEISSIRMNTFPNASFVDKLALDISAGVGDVDGEDPIQTNPQALVSWSLDGGVTYGNPLAREIGAQGEYTKRVTVNRLGKVSGKGFAVKIVCSDPVDFTFYGGDATARGRAT